jgi:hypothetical protein
MKKVYISGPMTGIENFNYPVFNATAEYLEQRGFLPINPARHPIGLEYDAYMEYAELDVKNCDVVVLLPGFNASKGANAEIEFARQFNKPIQLIGEFETCLSN